MLIGYSRNLKFLLYALRIASAMAATFFMDFTSCTRTTFVPFMMAAVTAAAVPSMRSVGAPPVILPMKRLPRRPGHNGSSQDLKLR